MDFDAVYNLKCINHSNENHILDLVDEYTLYCHYTNIDPLLPGKAYRAPYYRIDNVPSFTIFESKYGRVGYMWKDQATGESGNIFTLIKRIEGFKTYDEVYAKINSDFALGLDLPEPLVKEKIKLYEVPERSDIKIKVVDIPFTNNGKTFWEGLDVDKNLLDFYKTTQISYYWTYEGQTAPISAFDPTFAYRIGKYYQLYSPGMPKNIKFRNDLPENYFFGYLQLPQTGEVLVIDKSAKDVIYCRTLDYWAVCGKSETTMIPHDKMLELKDRFKTIYLTLDPDSAGKKQTEKYLALYPWLKPRFLTQAKDKTFT